MATKTKSRKSQQAKARYIGKPAGTIQEREVKRGQVSFRGLVSRAEQWRRSSLSRWHQKPEPLPKLLSPWPIPGLANWIEPVNEPRNDKELEDVRRCAHRGQPSGDEGWTEPIGRR